MPFGFQIDEYSRINEFLSGLLGRWVTRRDFEGRGRNLPRRLPPGFPPPPAPPPTVPPPTDTPIVPPVSTVPPPVDTPPPLSNEPPPIVTGAPPSEAGDLDVPGIPGLPGIIETLVRGLGPGTSIGSGRLSKGVPVSIASILGRVGNIASIVSGITDVAVAYSAQRMPILSGRQQLQPLPGVAQTGNFRTGGSLQSLPAPGAMQMCPSGFHLAKDGSGRLVRNRRMNPLNAKAARRAIRRIKAARKMLTSIERSLPTRTVRRR